MVATNPNNRIPSVGSIPALPANRLAGREINFREPRITGDVIGLTDRENEGANARSWVSERELSLHAWLIERLLLLQDERLKQRSLWHKIRRYLFENRLGRLLGFCLCGPDETTEGGPLSY